MKIDLYLKKLTLLYIMRKHTTLLTTAILLFGASITQVEAQVDEAMTKKIIEEATTSSQLEVLAHELLDVIGPRLVGSPEMKQAHDWVIRTYNKWGIAAENQAYGEWKAWQRGTTVVTMTSPRIQSLQATQLAWSPATKKAVEAEVVHIPDIKTKEEFEKWTKTIKGKIVLASPYYASGRSEDQWKENATKEGFDAYMSAKSKVNTSLNPAILASGTRTLSEFCKALENKGAVGIVQSNWAGVIGSNRIFDAKTEKIPVVDVSYEDFSMLYRFSTFGHPAKIKLEVDNKHLGSAPTFNTIATIPGTSKADEYVILSAHLDSWDGAQGACDNGTGTILMMEVARIIKKLDPNPKRTIIIGHWGSEEQGLNGSRAYVIDQPEVIKNTKVLFNQDSGTGRINRITGQGFVHSYDYLGKWLSKVPKEYSQYIQTNFPDMPQNGGTDNASFVAAGIPAFNLSTQGWNYGSYTWHTNRDTYDKIVFEEVQRNVITTAILTIEAANDENEISNERRVLPLNEKGEVTEWPTIKEPTRKGRL